jgi:hypothetical protein
MAKMNFGPWGVVLELNNTEVNGVAAALTTTTALTTALSALGITGPATPVSAAATAILALGAALIRQCNANGRGIKLMILYIGVPTCAPL